MKIKNKTQEKHNKMQTIFIISKNTSQSLQNPSSIPSYSIIDSSFLFHSHALNFRWFILIPLSIPTVATLLPKKTQNPNNPKTHGWSDRRLKISGYD
jgi:hypothetical protein